MKSSIIIGTPGFMPLEQTVGKPLFASDIYSLGLTAIYLLTGKQPEELNTDPETGHILWKSHAPKISESFISVLNKAIEPNYRDRYLNAPAMLEALHSLNSNESHSGVAATKLDPPNRTPATQPQYISTPTPVTAMENYPTPSPAPLTQPQYYPQPIAPQKGNKTTLIIGGLAALALAGGVGVVWPKIAKQPPPQPDTQQQQGDNPTPPPVNPPNISPQAKAEIDTPPSITIGGQPEQGREPNDSMDGVWSVSFSAGNVPHESILVIKGVYGEMLTQYKDPASGSVEKVYQQMRLWSVSRGLLLKGHYPTNFQTKQPHPTYTPDQILMQRLNDKKFQGENCSGNTCAPTNIVYKAKSLQDLK